MFLVKIKNKKNKFIKKNRINKNGAVYQYRLPYRTFDGCWFKSNSVYNIFDIIYLYNYK